jgi:hypothetical protein
VPLTVGLLAAGLGPGPSLTFLLGSVGTCVPTLLMSRGIAASARPPSTSPTRAASSAASTLREKELLGGGIVSS